MQLLWLAVIPLWIFVCVSLGVGFFAIFERNDWHYRWFMIPLWMSFGCPLLAAGIGGIMFLLSKACILS